jgi:hypothetical protein
LFNGLTVALVHALRVLLSLNQMKPAMPRIAGPLLACALVFASAPTNAQASSDPATQDDREDTHPFTGSGQNGATGQPPTADDVRRALEQAAAENALPVEFFARVIWQESRYAKAVSPKGAEGIAQFMPRTGSIIGDREPIVLHKEIPGMGKAKRYIITIADDDRAPLDKLCQKLKAADATCDVLRNPIKQDQ